jgi:hypothetical protein
MKINVRLLYLYLFSFVGLLIVVIGCIRISDLALKTFVFKDADMYETYPVKDDASLLSPEEMQARQKRDQQRQKEREFSESLSMILIGAPLYLYHWKTIQKENKQVKEQSA